MDALRFDRDWGGFAGTVALCSDGTPSLCRSATIDLLESCHSRYSRALGGFLQRVNLWLKNIFHQTRVPAVILGRLIGIGIVAAAHYRHDRDVTPVGDEAAD